MCECVRNDRKVDLRISDKFTTQKQSVTVNIRVLPVTCHAGKDGGDGGITPPINKLGAT